MREYRKPGGSTYRESVRRRREEEEEETRAEGSVLKAEQATDLPAAMDTEQGSRCQRAEASATSNLAATRESTCMNISYHYNETWGCDAKTDVRTCNVCDTGSGKVVARHHVLKNPEQP